MNLAIRGYGFNLARINLNRLRSTLRCKSIDFVVDYNTNGTISGTPRRLIEPQGLTRLP
jgi:hypothetical protein